VHANKFDQLADSDSPVASRDSDLTARFVNDTLPYLDQLHARARRMTPGAVDADDLVQETVLRAYAEFNALSEGTELRTWLFGIMTDTYVNGLHRAQHRPSGYLIGPRAAAHSRHILREPRWRNSMQWTRCARLVPKGFITQFDLALGLSR
jgi:RNA polymerase sigma-70 factor, ECF subfamily